MQRVKENIQIKKNNEQKFYFPSLFCSESTKIPPPQKNVEYLENQDKNKNMMQLWVSVYKIR